MPQKYNDFYILQCDKCERHCIYIWPPENPAGPNQIEWSEVKQSLNNLPTEQSAFSKWWWAYNVVDKVDLLRTNKLLT